MKSLSRMRLEPLLFAALIVVHLLPVWLFRFLPTQDGAAHLYSAWVRLQLLQHPGGFYSAFYELRPRLEANSALESVLTLLLIFLKPLIAEKVLVSGYLILLPLAFRNLIRSIRPENTVFSYAIFPFLQNFFFQMGFHDFCYSFVLYFFTLAYWYRNGSRWTPVSVFIFSLLVLAGFFLHKIAGSALLLTLFILAAVFFIFDRAGMRAPGNFFPQLRNRLGPLLIPSAAVFLLSVFSVEKAGVSLVRAPSDWGLVLHFQPFSALSLPEYRLGTAIFAIGMTATLFRLALRRSRWERTDAFLAAALLFLFIFSLPFDLTAPGYNGGTAEVHPRWCAYFFVLWWTWLFAQPAGPLLKKAGTALICGVLFLALGVRLEKYAELNVFLEDFLSVAPAVKEESTVLGLISNYGVNLPDGTPVSMQTAPLLHTDCYLALERHSVPLLDFQANLRLFSLVFKGTRIPLNYFDQKRFGFSQFETKKYERETGIKIDYILLWGGDLPAEDPRLQGYSLKAVSPFKLTRLYERRLGP